MKRRSKVRILGAWIRIEYSDLASEEILGDCDVHKRVIRLDINMNDAEYKRVLAHEKFHMKVGLSGINELIPKEVEEALAVLMEMED